MKTPYALEQLNRSEPQAEAPPRPTDAERVADVVREHLVDGYFQPDAVGRWLDAISARSAPLQALVDCLQEPSKSGPAVHAAEGQSQCQRAFLSQVAPSRGASPWGLPVEEPPALGGRTQAAQLELDAERFVANAYSLAATLAAMRRGIGRNLELGAGIVRGVRDAKGYLSQRRWRRSLERRNTALVLSGGAANGAFSAGAVWRLLQVLRQCKTQGQCDDTELDLVVGTSTGALIGVLIDLFFTPGFEQQALDVLFQSYTCSTASDLYCSVNEWDWKLFEDLKGLVRFDGIQNLLEQHMVQQTLDNHTELVAVSVRLEDGQVYAESDQDPIDKGSREQRIQAVLASIVEPVLAMPVDRLPRSGAPLAGTFVDGGVRSVLPALDAVNRGAERVLVMTNGTMEPSPVPPPKHALGVLMRTLDVLIASGITEPQLAEARATTRRWTEYRVCHDRFSSWDAAARPDAGPAADTVEDSASAARRAEHEQAVEAFCRRSFLEQPEPPAAVPRAVRPNWSAVPSFPEVASSYRAEWFFRPERGQRSAVGYSFDPELMRELFLLGVETFQSRCHELMALFGWSAPFVEQACEQSPAQAVEAAKQQFRPLAECAAKKDQLRRCDD